MKICAVISEYNPFHNGHQYQLNKIKELTDCYTILCIMSGNYTQRGEIAILDILVPICYSVQVPLARKAGKSLIHKVHHCLNRFAI